jgi:lysophospholipase L1-like esterase
MGELALRLVSLPLAPLAYAQGRRVRASLPPPRVAAGDPFGLEQPPEASTAAPLGLLVLGESPVAGCGIALHRDALAAHIATALAEAARAPVAWRAIGAIGITARRAAREMELNVAAASRVDLAVVALGVNDVLGQTSARAFARDLAAVITMIHRHHQGVPVVLAGVPPVGCFPALPQPLRALLGWRASWLDRAAERLARRSEKLAYVRSRIERGDRALFAADGFHPSPLGCAAWARELAAAMPPVRRA